MDKLDECIRKLDLINGRIREARLGTAGMIVTIWIAMFFLPALTFIGAVLWITHH